MATIRSRKALRVPQDLQDAKGASRCEIATSIDCLAVFRLPTHRAQRLWLPSDRAKRFVYQDLQDAKGASRSLIRIGCTLLQSFLLDYSEMIRLFLMDGDMSPA